MTSSVLTTPEPASAPSEFPADALLFFGTAWARFYAGEETFDLPTRVLLAAIGYGDEHGRAVFGWGVLAEVVRAPGPLALAHAIASQVESGALRAGSSTLILVPSGDWTRLDEEPTA